MAKRRSGNLPFLSASVPLDVPSSKSLLERIVRGVVGFNSVAPEIEHC